MPGQDGSPPSDRVDEPIANASVLDRLDGGVDRVLPDRRGNLRVDARVGGAAAFGTVRRMAVETTELRLAYLALTWQPAFFMAVSLARVSASDSFGRPSSPGRTSTLLESGSRTTTNGLKPI
jgi:hypothetical protein